LGTSKGPKVRNLQGKFQQSSKKETYHYGNEEESHQEGCQKEKEVTEHGEASGLANFLATRKASADVAEASTF
jgi:hypothetical protein